MRVLNRGKSIKVYSANPQIHSQLLKSAKLDTHCYTSRLHQLKKSPTQPTSSQKALIKNVTKV
jgi:hypothetical protein